MSRLVLSAALTASTASLAQALRDPTRPSGAPAAVASVAPTGAAVPVGVVSMILISPNGVEAVLDGERVRVGSRTARGTVVKIERSTVCLRDAQGKPDCLRLYPEVGLQDAAAGHSEKTAKQ